MKTSLVILALAVIASATALALTGVIAGDDVLDLLKTLAAGVAGGGVAGAIVKR